MKNIFLRCIYGILLCISSFSFSAQRWLQYIHTKGKETQISDSEIKNYILLMQEKLAECPVYVDPDGGNAKFHKMSDLSKICDPFFYHDQAPYNIYSLSDPDITRMIQVAKKYQTAPLADYLVMRLGQKIALQEKNITNRLKKIAPNLPKESVTSLMEQIHIAKQYAIPCDLVEPHQPKNPLQPSILGSISLINKKRGHKGLTSLRGIELIKNKDKVRSLYLAGHTIPYIKPGQFNELRSVQDMRLDGNNIKVIPTGTFGILCNQPHKISLAWNKLTNLQSGVFTNPELQELDLSYNAIAQIAPDAIQAPDLEKLNLKNNNLSTLPPRFLSKFPQVQVELQGNPWTQRNLSKFAQEQGIGIYNIKNFLSSKL